MNIFGGTISLLERGLEFFSYKREGYLPKHRQCRHAEL